MLKKITIENYFKISNKSQIFTEANLFFGKNGTQKTTFCDAIFYAVNGFSQLNNDFNVLKNNQNHTQLKLEFEHKENKTQIAKTIITNYKKFFIDDQKCLQNVFLYEQPLFFISTQTPFFQKNYLQPQFLHNNVAQFNNDHKKILNDLKRIFNTWVHFDSNVAEPNKEQFLMLEKSMANKMFLIWENNNKFIEELNKSILYLNVQHFANLQPCQIKLQSWIKKSENQNAIDIERKIIDFWMNKRLERKHLIFRNVPIISDTVAFSGYKTTQTTHTRSWTEKQLIKLIFYFSIAWLIKNQNKKVIFILDGFDFLDNDCCNKILQLLTYFHQVFISTTQPELWPIKTHWPTTSQTVRFAKFEQQPTNNNETKITS